MCRYISLLFITLSCASAFGGSIFDDNYVPPPEKPAEKPAAPVPPVRRDTTPPDDNTNNKTLPPDNTAINDAPGREVPDRQPPVEDPAKVALAAAQDALKQEEAVADAALQKDTAYVAALEKAKTEVEKGLAESPALVRAQKIRETYLAKDDAYQIKKKYVIMLTRLTQTTRFVRRPAVKSQEEFRQEIVDAITGHTLVEGMSFQEACKSARKPYELVSKEGMRKTYRWVLKGSTGSHQEAHRGIRGGITYETVATYGVIGYVVGVFEDDYLISFSRQR